MHYRITGQRSAGGVGTIKEAIQDVTEATLFNTSFAQKQRHHADRQQDIHTTDEHLQQED